MRLLSWLPSQGVFSMLLLPSRGHLITSRLCISLFFPRFRSRQFSIGYRTVNVPVAEAPSRDESAKVGHRHYLCGRSVFSCRTFFCDCVHASKCIETSKLFQDVGEKSLGRVNCNSWPSLSGNSGLLRGIGTLKHPSGCTGSHLSKWTDFQEVSRSSLREGCLLGRPQCPGVGSRWVQRHKPWIIIVDVSRQAVGGEPTMGLSICICVFLVQSYTGVSTHEPTIKGRLSLQTIIHKNQ